MVAISRFGSSGFIASHHGCLLHLRRGRFRFVLNISDGDGVIVESGQGLLPRSLRRICIVLAGHCR